MRRAPPPAPCRAARPRGAKAHATSGRRRGRRRSGRVDRGPRAAARRQVGARARGRAASRRPRLEPPARRRRGVGARRHVRRPDPGPHDRPRQGATAIGTFPTYNEGNNVAYIEGDRVEWSDTGPTGTAPPDPAILPELAATVALLDEMSKEVPVDAPWEAAKALEYDGQTLETWIRDNSATPALSRPRAAGNPADLRHRAARPLAALRPLLHRRLRATRRTRARSSATSTRATARRCSGSRAARARWWRGWRRELGTQAPAAAAGSPDRAGSRRRARRDRQAVRAGKARRRRGAAGARRADRLLGPRCRSSATSSRSGWARGRSRR